MNPPDISPYLPAIYAFIVLHFGSLWAIAVWGIKRVIEWTHMKRDILELQQTIEKLEKDLNAAHSKIREQSDSRTTPNA